MLLYDSARIQPADLPELDPVLTVAVLWSISGRVLMESDCLGSRRGYPDMCDLGRHSLPEFLHV